MHRRLRPDESLIVSFDAFDAFWMFTNESIFGNSMDCLYQAVSISQGHTPVAADGRVRLVLAGRYPGLANWIDTQGFAEGVFTFRIGTTHFIPALDTEKMPRDELPGRLPDARHGRRCGGRRANCALSRDQTAVLALVLGPN